MNGNQDLKNLIRMVILLSMAAVLLPRAGRAQESQRIRVLVLDDVPSVAISVDGRYRITDSAEAMILYEGSDLRGRFTGSRSSISWGEKNFPGRAISVISVADRPIGVNNKKYRGSIQIIRTGPGRLSVVDVLDVEDYVKGVAVRETSHYWPMEALKAQTVVFRTFALYRKGQSRTRDFDVTADVFSQGYGGQAAERYRISEAVDQTKGEVLYYGGRILPAFYHATCGGHTEDASELWDITIRPLKGVACGFCRESPYFSWKAAVPKKTIREAWNKKQPGLPQVTDVAVRGVTASGRVKTIVVRTAERDFTLPAKDFRHLLGQDIIRSTAFRTGTQGKDIVFEGRGWGHGVGLCQWGAYSMAKKGRRYRDILSFYYPSSIVTRKTE